MTKGKKGIEIEEQRQIVDLRTKEFERIKRSRYLITLGALEDVKRAVITESLDEDILIRNAEVITEETKRERIYYEILQEDKAKLADLLAARNAI